MKDILRYHKRKDDIKEIQKYLGIDDYFDFYNVIVELCNAGILTPIKSSKLNGKSKALYNRYYINKPQADYSQYCNELKNGLHPLLDTSYYMKNIEKYLEDRHYVLALSDYLTNNNEDLQYMVSENERSFAIWQEEKYLKDGGGKVLLKRLCLDVSYLNFYKTPQPFVYYSCDNSKAQNILILENKDTYYTVRKLMLEGKNTFFGIKFSTVMYGAGKLILSKQGVFDFLSYSEPWITSSDNMFYYLGDIDFEGFVMYEKLKKIIESDNINININIKLFSEAIEKMVLLGENIIDKLPRMKEGQNKNIDYLYRTELPCGTASFIDSILRDNKYIPQEILTYRYFRES